MSEYTALLNNLEELKLLQIKDNLDDYIDMITNGGKTVVDALYELSELEIKLKEEKAIHACVRVANFLYKDIGRFWFFISAFNKSG